MVDSFAERLAQRIEDVGPLCGGVDPSRALVTAWGREDTVEGLEFCARALVEALVGSVAAIKPQVAYFERFGSAGYRVLERVFEDARDAEVLIVADAKRGDIGSTNDGYVEAWMSERSPLRADAVTVSPYLGVEALSPFFRAGALSGRGVFVLAATSNDEGRVIQGARIDEYHRVQEHVLASVAAVNREAPGTVGVVLGATRERPDFDLTTLGGPYLVPGVGAQGATPDRVGRLFERCERGSVLVNVSRAISDAGPERAGLRDAARRWRDDLVGALL